VLRGSYQVLGVTLLFPLSWVYNIELTEKKMDVLGRNENIASPLVSEVEGENPETEDHGNT
jgi:hypothetical protein